MSLTLQQATIHDALLLQQLSITTFTETFAAQNSVENLNQYLEKAYNIRQLEAELRNENSTFFILLNGKELLGYLKLNIENAQTETIAEDAVEIERIYILKQHKRNGYGKVLIETAETFAKNNQKQSIWLGVWEKNVAAIKFYHKRGFTQISSHSFFMGEDEQIDLIMSKKINDNG